MANNRPTMIQSRVFGHQSKGEPAGQINLFGKETNKLHRLISSGRYYALSRQQTVQSSDDRYMPLVNLVKAGYIKRYEICNDGSIAVQAIYGPGNVFPLTLVFKTLFNQELYDGPEVIYYESMTDAEVYSIDALKISDAAKRDPSLYRDILLEAGARTHSNIQRLENLSLKSSLKRTAHQLAYFARQFGEKGLYSTKIKVLLTHQDIADVLSLTRETVSVNMGKLQDRHLIKAGRNIEIIDLPGLEKLAYS